MPRRWMCMSSGSPGQELDITGAPAGIYYLVSTVNAECKFIESNYANNVAAYGRDPCLPGTFWSYARAAVPRSRGSASMRRHPSPRASRDRDSARPNGSRRVVCLGPDRPSLVPT